MHQKNLLIIIVVLNFINACKSSDNDQFHFDPRIIKENVITLSDIADDIVYLPIANSFPVGNTGHFTFIHQSIYFYSNEGIILFDRTKNELRKIGRIGRGPGEYLFYSRFTVDEKTGSIYIFDQDATIKTYSKAGQFLKSIPLQKLGATASLEFFEGALFVSYALQYGNSRYSWIIFDTLGNVIKMRKSGIPTFNSIYGNSYTTYRLGNRIYYWNSYTDTVFSVLPDLTEEPSFYISPGEHRFPKSREVPINPYEKYLVFHSVFETTRYIVIEYYFKNSILLLYDKLDKESFLINLEDEQNSSINGIFNDLDGGPMFLPSQSAFIDGKEYMVGSISPLKIKTLVATDEFKKSVPTNHEKKHALEKLAKSLEETDNPIIMMIRLKNKKL